MIVGSLRGDLWELQGYSKVIFEMISDDVLNIVWVYPVSIQELPGSNFVPSF